MGLAPQQVLQAVLDGICLLSGGTLSPAPHRQCEWHPHCLHGLDTLHPAPAILPRAVGKPELQIKSSRDQKQFVQHSTLPGCTEPRYLPMMMKPGIAKGET